jgi:hypothetical protein
MFSIRTGRGHEEAEVINEQDDRPSDASVGFALLKLPFPMLAVQDGVVVCGAVLA